MEGKKGKATIKTGGAGKFFSIPLEGLEYC